jgi:hypothetical protein
MEQKHYTTLRVLKADAALLKVVAALSRETMLQTFKRLVRAEYDRVVGGKRNVAHQEDQA